MMNQTLTGNIVGIAALIFLTVYLALRYWAAHQR